MAASGRAGGDVKVKVADDGRWLGLRYGMDLDASVCVRLDRVCGEVVRMWI